MLILMGAIWSALFFIAVPVGAEKFVVMLFSPSSDEQAKDLDWVKFADQTYASCKKGTKQQINEGKDEIKKEYINEEYILDFSTKVRTVYKEGSSTEYAHGYAKGKWEWYVSAPLFGDHAIILEPWIAFTVVIAVFALALAVVLTSFFPTSIGWLSANFSHIIDETAVKLRLQTGFDDNIVDLLVMPDDQLATKDPAEVRRAFRLVWDRTITDDMASSFQAMKFDDVFSNDIDIVYFRNSLIYNRIKEFFSEFVLIEIEDLKNALLWQRNHFHFLKGFRLYMSHHFCEKFQNLTTGLAYGGAAILIIAIGVRGIKFIPPTKPSIILFAITLEFSLLLLLALTLLYTESEERMDKMLKKMEDANRSQLEALRGQQADIHQLSNALVGQTAEIIKNRVENAIEDYMTSGDNVQKVVAEEIAKKIIFSVRDEHGAGYNKAYVSETKR
jgi:hypothetical protein